MAAPRKIRDIIRSNEDELLTYGSLGGVASKSRGQEFTAFYLNEEQALLVCMFSKTVNAALVRKQVIATLMAYRRGQRVVCNSRDVADYFGKKHMHVNRTGFAGDPNS